MPHSAQRAARRRRSASLGSGVWPMRDGSIATSAARPSAAKRWCMGRFGQAWAAVVCRGLVVTMGLLLIAVRSATHLTDRLAAQLAQERHQQPVEAAVALVE